MHPSEYPTSEHPTTAFGTGYGTGEHRTAVQPPPVGPAGNAGGKFPAGTGGRRSPDLVALVAGALFVLIAVLGLVGSALPGWVFGGGLVAVVLVALGAGLLATELRRIRR